MFDTGPGHEKRGSAEPAEGAPAPFTEAEGLTALPLERLEHEIVQLASHINAGTCRWLELVAEFDRREGWGSWDCRSCAEWVAWRCALDPRSAREHVRVARRLEDLPRIHAAFARGELSYSKVRALTRVAEAGSEEDLLEIAEHATAAQLDRIVRGLRRMNTDDANEAHAQRFLSCWWEPDGSLSVSGSLPAEDGAAFLNAINAMHDLLRARSENGAPHDPGSPNGTSPDRGLATSPCARSENGSAEPASEADTCGSAEPAEPRPATNADALAAMAEAVVAGTASGRSGGERDQANEASGRPGGERYQLVVHVDAATLASDAPGTSRIEDGSALAPETVRRLACDCSIVPLVEAEDGSALSVGRRTRSIPPSIARALRARDGTCAFPGCENRRFLDAHHIHHWAKGGETSSGNLVLLCGRHHRLVHEGRYSIERALGASDSVRAPVLFRDPHGLPLFDAPSPPCGDITELTLLAKRRGTAEATPHPGTGERLDLDLALAALG